VRLGAYVPRQAGLGGQLVYSVYHKSLSDWLTEPNREGQVHYVPLRHGHAGLAEICWKEYQSGGIEKMASYERNFARVHLEESGRLEDARKLWLDYLHYRIETAPYGMYRGSERFNYENKLEEFRNEISEKKRWHPLAPDT
jgi:hypothetical protein